MSCYKCGKESAFAKVTGVCLSCNQTPDGIPVAYLPKTNTPPQPTLRDMWAMAVFQKMPFDCWLERGTKVSMEYCYDRADSAMKARDGK